MSTHSFKPHARLLTMIGEQLVADERIALIELAKNAYDADSPNVLIAFMGFNDRFGITDSSMILIEDSGIGMDEADLKAIWLTPATPHKKQLDNKYTKKYNRRIQGEKGIGRFALLKLGKKITIITKKSSAKKEARLELDLTPYDDDFLEENNKPKDISLDDIQVMITEQEPTVFKGEDGEAKSGTQILIHSLRGKWSEASVLKVHKSLTKLQSLVIENDPENTERPIQIKSSSDFEVELYKNGDLYQPEADAISTLEELVNSSTVLKVTNGQFDPKKNQLFFDLNGEPISLDLDSSIMRSLSGFRKYLKDSYGIESHEKFSPKCGPFLFSLFIFDLNAQSDSAYYISRPHKEIVKSHRVYLYRDGVRVHPYGDPEDDWLQLDTMRGTSSLGDNLSNDQVFGVIEISHEQNPGLVDKTSREGLIDTGDPKADFTEIIRALLTWLKSSPYKKYAAQVKVQKEAQNFAEETLEKDLLKIKNELLVKGDDGIAKKIEQCYRNVKSLRAHLTNRAEKTEELAGVGLTVEIAAHDIVHMSSKAVHGIRSILNSGDLTDSHRSKLEIIQGAVQFIHSHLIDIQELFRPARRKRKIINVNEIVDKASKIFESSLKEESVNFDIISNSDELKVKTTDAVLLQVLLNLFDNSIYWLKNKSKTNRKIQIHINSIDSTVVFSDNGPGVSEDNLPFIFTAFFSSKGEEGKGLGLYIARQLLERHGFSIDYINPRNNDAKLSGANFLIDFGGK